MQLRKSDGFVPGVVSAPAHLQGQERLVWIFFIGAKASNRLQIRLGKGGGGGIGLGVRTSVCGCHVIFIDRGTNLQEHCEILGNFDVCCDLTEKLSSLNLNVPAVPSGSLDSGREKLPSLNLNVPAVPSSSLCSCQEKFPSLNLNVPAVPSSSLCSGQEKLLPLKPVLNWANCLFAEHTSDSSTNYNSFLN